MTQVELIFEKYRLKWERGNSMRAMMLEGMKEYAEQQIAEYSQAYQLRQSEVINQLYARITELESKQKTDAGLAIDKTRNDREARILDRFLKQSKDAN